jgi:hypothetical protein
MIEETQDYWIFKDWLIFKPQFNRELDNELLFRFNKLIFSNFCSLELCLETKNENNFPDCTTDYWYFKSYIGSAFDQDNIVLHDNLTHILFGYHFNQNIILPPKLIYLNVGESFNQPISFGDVITYLILGINFNTIIKFPPSLKYLKINCQVLFDSIIENLPNNIEILQFGTNCYPELNLNNLPNSIKQLIFDNNFNLSSELNCLSDTIEHIKLPTNYKFEIKKLPLNLKKISCSENYINNNKNFYEMIKKLPNIKIIFNTTNNQS